MSRFSESSRTCWITASALIVLCIFLHLLSVKAQPSTTKHSVEASNITNETYDEKRTSSTNPRPSDVAISDRIGETCSKEDIVVYQGATTPMPNGIPTYTVQILNVCVTGCPIRGIHLTCGWFSSARMINPKIFKRLKYNDCLVNDGKPLKSGASVSFQYANTYSYPLAVSSVTCH